MTCLRPFPPLLASSRCPGMLSTTVTLIAPWTLSALTKGFEFRLITMKESWVSTEDTLTGAVNPTSVAQPHGSLFGSTCCTCSRLINSGPCTVTLQYSISCFVGYSNPYSVTGDLSNSLCGEALSDQSGPKRQEIAFQHLWAQFHSNPPAMDRLGGPRSRLAARFCHSGTQKWPILSGVTGHGSQVRGQGQAAWA